MILVKTGGSYYDIGFDIGVKTKTIVQELVKTNPAFMVKHTQKSLLSLKQSVQTRFGTYMKRYPDFLEELRGLSAGAKVAYDDLLLLAVEEEILDSVEIGVEKCSSAILKTKNNYLLIHNEDFLPRYLGKMVMVIAEPNNQPKYLGIAYPGHIEARGFNDQGVAFSENSLLFKLKSRGVPKDFLLRDIFRAKQLSEVIGMVTASDRICACNVNVISARENLALQIETSTSEVDLMALGKRKFMIHTNHALSRNIDNQSEQVWPTSRLRYANLDYLLGRAKNFTLPILKNILSSTKHGILCQESDPLGSYTVLSLIFDPAAKTIWIADRRDQPAKFKKFTI